jgi:hypothetical protein
MRRSLLALAVLAGSAGPACAQTHTFEYRSFADVSAFSFAGSAAAATTGIGNQVLRLVPDQVSQSGSAYLATPLLLGPDGAFSTAFRFRIHGASDNQWSDGLTFVLAAAPAGLGASSAAGGNLGYQGVANSLAVEFDTYFNSDTDAAPNEVAVDTDGSISVIDGQGQGCGVSGRQPPSCLADAAEWTARITYDGHLINVTVQDGTNPVVPVVTNYPVNLRAVLGGTTAYVGFTAGTGAGHADFDVLGWAMRY